MLAKIPAFILSIIMSVAALFGAPFHDSGSSQGLYGQLPLGAVPATDTQLESIRTGTWVSVERSSTSMSFEKRVSSNDLPRQVPELNDEFAHGVPAELQSWKGTGGCNLTNSYVFFMGAEMNRTKFAHTTLIGCDASTATFDTEANQLFTAKPVIHVVPGSENSEIYLVTGNGAAKFVRR